MSNKHIQTHLEMMKDCLKLMEHSEGDNYRKVEFVGSILSLFSPIQKEKLNVLYENKPYLLSSITHDFWNLGNVLHRLEWQKEKLKDVEPVGLWYTYASMDIEYFYTVFRSLCDYFAELIASCYSGTPNIPNSREESFYKLLVWVHRKKDKLDKDFLKIFKQANLLKGENEIYRTWFGHIREIRDDIIHRGANSIIYGEPNEGILFQIKKRDFNNTISALPHIKYNDNGIIYFDRYASLQISSLLNFTEYLARYIIKKYDLKETETRCSSFDVVYKWMSEFKNRLEMKN
ncbi:MAG: hypothetical protein FXF47_08475 [Candidatus Mcinerneyibacterium aminivorans]|uniref:Cthe-2314-like HEPN domain-containing protein n=1 Tax=Candidatus Mcinerneyibacterium aminivorans TaxID=2703815 RepID=A0A5D0MGJ7_9BACT|nr:MAG: hypothetical protein FXF47_08475 [Candidatus Mcinerneyibacterium aminivorans]